MSVPSTLTRVYERNSIFAARKTKPIQTQFAEVLKMKVSLVLTRSYGDMAALTARRNKPKQSQFRYLLCSRPSPHLLIDCGFLKGALHVCRYGKVLFDDAASAARWVDRRLRLLWQGRTKKLPDALKRLRKRYRGRKREVIDGLHRYISGNEEQMRLKNPPAIMNHTLQGGNGEKPIAHRLSPVII